MGYLTINRKKQSEKIYEKCLDVTIDGAQTFKIANGETQKIELPEGKHHIKFSYFCDPCDEVPFIKSIPFVNLVQANCMYEEQFELIGNFEYSVSIDLDKFKIINSNGKVKSNKKDSELIYFCKKIYLAGAMFFPSLILMLIAIYQWWDFPMITFLSFFLYSAILLVTPTAVNIVKTYKADHDTRKNLDRIFYSRHLKHSFIALAALVVIMLLVAFLLSHFIVTYCIISIILVAMAEAVIVAMNFDKVTSKIVGLVLVIALVLTTLIGFIPISSPTDPDGIEGWTQCYKCNKTGKVKNNFGFYVTCPRCGGVGYLPD